MEERSVNSYGVNPGAKLEVRNLNGNVNIIGRERGDVEIVAVKKADGAEEFDGVTIEVKNDGGGIFVETKYSRKDSRVSVDYEIRVPSSLSIASVRNVNGSITLENTSGDSNLATLNGKIDVRGAKGAINAKTSNGRITVCGAAGITNLETMNGVIEAEIDELKNDVSLSAGNGKIVIRAAKGIDADINLKSSMGGVSVSGFELARSRQAGGGFEGRAGKGGHRITAVASIGKIELDCKG